MVDSGGARVDLSPHLLYSTHLETGGRVKSGLVAAESGLVSADVARTKFLRRNAVCKVTDWEHEKPRGISRSSDVHLR